MSYSPATDFLALFRNGVSGVTPLEMPGLDFVVAAFARAGLISLSVGQTAPVANQATTAWFQPALPTYAAEGVLFLWNAGAAAYTSATPVLWKALLGAVSETATSTTSRTVGTGPLTFVTQANKLFVPGEWVTIQSRTDVLNYMVAVITAYVSTSLSVDVAAVSGGGTHADWNIISSGPPGPVGPVGPVGPPGPPQLFDTRTAAATAVNPATVHFIQTAGYATIGDGGGTLYSETGGLTLGGFVDAGGRFWEIAANTVCFETFGGFPNGADITTAFAAAMAHPANLVTLPGNYVIARNAAQVATVYSEKFIHITAGTIITYGNGFVLVGIGALNTNVSNVTIIVDGLITGSEAVPTTFGGAFRLGNGTQFLTNVSIAGRGVITQMGEYGFFSQPNTTFANVLVDMTVTQVGGSWAGPGDAIDALDFKPALGSSNVTIRGRYACQGTNGSSVPLKASNIANLIVDAVAEGGVQGCVQFNNNTNMDVRIRPIYHTAAGYLVSINSNSGGSIEIVNGQTDTVTVPVIFGSFGGGGGNANVTVSGKTNGPLSLVPAIAHAGMILDGMTSSKSFDLNGAGATWNTGLIRNCTTPHMHVAGNSNEVYSNRITGDGVNPGIVIEGDGNVVDANRSIGSTVGCISITGDNCIVPGHFDTGTTGPVVTVNAGSDNTVLGGDFVYTAGTFLSDAGTNTLQAKWGWMHAYLGAWTPGLTPASTTVTVSGAAIGDLVLASFNAVGGAVAVSAIVTAADTVVVTVIPETGTPTLGAGQLRVWLIKCQ